MSPTLLYCRGVEEGRLLTDKERRHPYSAAITQIGPTLQSTR